MEIVTVDEIRDEYGEEVADMTDNAIQRRLDRMAAYMGDTMGHYFGRALLANSSNAAHTVAVSATGLTIGGDTYLFATYTTLISLVDAVNGAGKDYSLHLFSFVNPNTPSELLKVVGVTACGPNYSNRVTLDVTALYTVLSGEGRTHIFLDYPIREIVSLLEDGTSLTSGYYWLRIGTPWLIRKACTCVIDTTCTHPKGWWPATYPNNIIIRYKPTWWGMIPGAVQAAMFEAWESYSGVGPLQSEKFGTYSYTREVKKVSSWEHILSGTVLAPYQPQPAGVL